MARETSSPQGQSVRVAVLNGGDAELEYGLGGLVLQRLRPSGDWTTIAGDLDRVRRVRLVVAPGETAGPSYAGAVDRIRVPRDAKPGIYRVAKQVQGPATRRRVDRAAAHQSCLNWAQPFGPLARGTFSRTPSQAKGDAPGTYAAKLVAIW